MTPYLARKARSALLRLRRAKRMIHHRPKRFLGVYAIMQNEAHIIREWMDLHLREGVEHFYLVDHGSTDDWRARIADHIEAGRVTVKPIGSAQGSSIVLRQIHADFALDDCEWLIMQDLDEFLFAHRAASIADVLRQMPQDVAQVAVPWVVFGTAGNQAQPRFVVEGCLRSEDMDARAGYPDEERAWHVKSIVRSRKLHQVAVHMHDVRGRTVVSLPGLPEAQGNFYIPNALAARWSEALLLQNHYIHQSWEFYQRKMTRQGYWWEAHRGRKSYTPERFEREEPLLNQVENRTLFEKHRGYFT